MQQVKTGKLADPPRAGPPPSFNSRTAATRRSF